MRLLTIGAGKAAKIVDRLAKDGAEVNNVKLFKCYTISETIEELKEIKSVPDNNKFFALWSEGNVELRSIINSIMSRYEIYEASLVVSDLTDRFSYVSAVSLYEELEKVMEEPKICLAVIPNLSNPVNVAEVRTRIRNLMKLYDYIFVFEAREGYEDTLVDVFNTLSLVGEIDAKKRSSGEVVVDTSDFLNSLDENGFTVAGFSKRNVGFGFIKKFFKKSSAELRGERTKRMVEMIESSLNNLSARGDVNTAKKALIVFSGNPEEITMEGLFSSIKRVEKINSDLIIRYGDYPVPRANFVSAVVLFSGITRFTL